MAAEGYINRSLNLSSELYARVQEYRFQARVKAESEAIRRLLEAGLEAEANRLASLVNDMRKP